MLHEVHRADGYPLAWPDDPVAWLSPLGLLAAWVAECADSRIGGHIALTSSEIDVATAGSDALVSRLFVALASRRRRVGHHLLNHAQRHAVGMGKSLMLEAAELGDGAAIALYERSGWLHVATRTATWTTPGGQPVSLRYYRSPT
jgi:GNAT superfamily N-acetyltransferase